MHKNFHNCFSFVVVVSPVLIYCSSLTITAIRWTMLLLPYLFILQCSTFSLNQINLAWLPCQTADRTWSQIVPSSPRPTTRTSHVIEVLLLIGIPSVPCPHSTRHCFKVSVKKKDWRGLTRKLIHNIPFTWKGLHPSIGRILLQRQLDKSNVNIYVI